MKNVNGCVESAVENSNQSSPRPRVRSTGSKERAGFKKTKGASTVPGHGPPRSKSIIDGMVSFGSNTSSFRTFVTAVSKPKTPAPR